jgi:CRP-like cAMP-binding protein
MITTAEKVLFLKGVELFSEIPGQDLVQVAAIARPVTFEEGDEIITQGDVGNCLYLIIEGEVDVVTGGIYEVARLGEKQVFGEMSILDEEPRSASVVAATDVIMLKIDQGDFYEMMTLHIEVARGVIALLTRRLRRATSTQNTSSSTPPA